MQIRIVGIPPGESPDEVRRAWVGLVLPLVPGQLGLVNSANAPNRSLGFLRRLWRRFTGQSTQQVTYLVSVDEAIGILEKSSPSAAAWWRANRPQLFGAGKQFGFNAEVCHLLADHQARLNFPKPRKAMDLKGTLFVALDLGDGAVTIIDRMAYEYLYSDVQKPDPSQASLDAVLTNAARIKVWAGGMLKDAPLTPQLLWDESTPEAVAAFRRALRICEDPATFGHCMCMGQPTLELLDAAGARIATLGLQHGRAVRWDFWKHDALLAEGQMVAKWLVDRGIAAEQLK